MRFLASALDAKVMKCKKVQVNGGSNCKSFGEPSDPSRRGSREARIPTLAVFVSLGNVTPQKTTTSKATTTKSTTKTKMKKARMIMKKHELLMLRRSVGSSHMLPRGSTTKNKKGNSQAKRKHSRENKQDSEKEIPKSSKVKIRLRC